MASECGCKLDLVIVHASDGPTTDSIINRSECRIADLERQLAEAQRDRDVAVRALELSLPELHSTLGHEPSRAKLSLLLETAKAHIARAEQERDAANARAEAAERERALDICKTPEWQSVNAERLAMGTKLRQAEKLANLSQDNQERWMKIADLRQVQLEAAERERDRLKELLDPGTLEARIDWLAEYTEKEFHHNRFSARGFETTLVKGVADLRVRIAQLEQERDAKEEELDVWRNEATPSQQRAAKRIAQLEAALPEAVEYERQRAVEICDLTLGRMIDRDRCAKALRNPDTIHPSKPKIGVAPRTHRRAEAVQGGT